MDSMVKIDLDRANNEFMLANAIIKISENSIAKKELEIPAGSTFYNVAISQSYYSIFYAAKAILLSKNINTTHPNIHKKTLEEFENKLVRTGLIDVKLLEIYKRIVVRADELLEIFREEKGKRGQFTYNTIAQANKEPAKDSIKNSEIFISNIMKLLK